METGIISWATASEMLISNTSNIQIYGNNISQTPIQLSSSPDIRLRFWNPKGLPNKNSRSHYLRYPVHYPPCWSHSCWLQKPFICTQCAQATWDRHHSARQTFHALVISRLTYAAPSWSGFRKESHWAALQAVLNKGLKWGLSLQHYDLCTIIQKGDSTLFVQVLTNSNHCLHNLLPPLKSHSHDLRPRPHNRIIPVANSNISRCSFLQRMLSKNAY